ncbi:hypothetical protein BGX31_006981 [Mortierella sp. GBA43]|nr:hypothetical protein BGX31_006981 [Mortierella sp. GBA43]
MAFTRKQPTVPASPTASSKASTKDTTSGTSFLKRKPVKAAAAAPTESPSSSCTPHSANKTSSTFTSPWHQQSISNMAGPPSIPQIDVVYSQTQRTLPLVDATGMGMGMGIGMNTNFLESPKTPKTFKQSQDELYSKLEALAAVKNKVNPLEHERQARSGTRVGGGVSSSGRGGLAQQMNNKYPSMYNKSNNGLAYGDSSTGLLQPESRRQSYGSQAMSKPRRRVNSAQFKTPSAADMAELAQVVVANSAPPKTQDRLRKRASTLSLTTSTFAPPGSQNPSIVATTPGGGLSSMEQDFRQRYDAACKIAKQWEKKYSAAQQQIHYERERWEEKYGALEKTLRDLENSKTEANMEKMNSLLDTVQQLQIANETFRKQLIDAGIEPDPSPAIQFHSHHLLVGEKQDKTFLEENERMKEQSLVVNQKISHLSTEISNSAVAISQIINYVQLRYLTQMLDAAEHVTSQKRARAMSNSFISDMLSRGVKKASSLQPKNTCTTSTQTPAIMLTAVQLRQQQQFQQQFIQEHLVAAANGGIAFKGPDSKLTKSFSLSSTLFGLAGFQNGNNDNNNGGRGHQYRLRGSVMDDRSQLDRQGIPPGVFRNLKGSPTYPDSVDAMAASRGPTPLPKFQYASPTSSQLRICVPDEVPPFGYRTPSDGSGSQADNIHHGAGDSVMMASKDGSLRRSSSEISINQLQHQSGQARVGGKYPYPYAHPSRSSSQKSEDISTTCLTRSVSQHFLSPETAIMQK